MLKRSEIVLVAIVVVVINAIAVYVNDDQLSNLVSLANGLVPLVIWWLRERRSEIKTIEGFGWTWGFLVMYGTVILFVAIQLVGLVGSLVAASVLSVPSNGRMTILLRGQFQVVTVALVVSAIFWGIPLYYLCGRLMGRRTTSNMSIYRGAVAELR